MPQTACKLVTAEREQRPNALSRAIKGVSQCLIESSSWLSCCSLLHTERLFSIAQRLQQCKGQTKEYKNQRKSGDIFSATLFQLSVINTRETLWVIVYIQTIIFYSLWRIRPLQMSDCFLNSFKLSASSISRNWAPRGSYVLYGSYFISLAVNVLPVFHNIHFPHWNATSILSLCRGCEVSGSRARGAWLCLCTCWASFCLSSAK